MSKELGEFVRTFVAPLLSGGDLGIAAPVRPRHFQEMLAAVHTLRRSDLGLLRLRRAQQLLADPGLPEPDGEELALWAAIRPIWTTRDRSPSSHTGISIVANRESAVMISSILRMS